MGCDLSYSGSYFGTCIHNPLSSALDSSGVFFNSADNFLSTTQFSINDRRVFFYSITNTFSQVIDLLQVNAFWIESRNRSWPLNDWLN
jgi:hypothetical protein